MDIVKTSIGLSKTIKNVPRFREILTVFAKNGFDELILQAGLNKFIPNFILPGTTKKRILDIKSGEVDSWQQFGKRLTESLEALGPSFIKIGQLLATREDLFDHAVILELKKLQDNVAPVPWNVIRGVIEENLGKSVDEVFSNIEEKPIGVASIGLAYKATLKQENTQVVIKVRRPGIERLIESDFEIVHYIITLLENSSEEIKKLGLRYAIEDFFKTITAELNFYVETTNCEKLKQLIGKIDTEKDIYIPDVYKKYSSREILVLELLDGTPFNQLSSIDEALKDKLIRAVSLFIHTILVDGFFHADLHGGNFFLLKSGRIGLIDFGLMGTLSKRNRSSLIAILYAMTTKNYENVVSEFLDVAIYEHIPDEAELARDLEQYLAPQLVLDLDQIDASEMFKSIITVLGKHRLFLPREWFVIFRALITLDGVGKSLKINFNLFELLEKDVSKMISNVVNSKVIYEEAIWIGRDSLNSLRVIPRHIRWALKEFSKKKYAFDVNLNGVQESLKSINLGLVFLSYALLSSVFLISGVAIYLNHQVERIQDIPTVVLIFWFGSLFFFFLGSRHLNKS